MKELNRFRQFLAEGQINEASLDDLERAVKGEHAKDVIESGEFTRVAQFGSGDDVSPPVNVMDELKDELSYFETEEDKDSDDYDDLMRDLEAAKEIAAAVKSLGGEVSYVSKGDGVPDLTFVYSVNEDGDLIGEAI
jgi:hypothetical protein